ncbi:hypothetical protein MHYP_G00265140 [Metynnis hypsauchen]
MSPCAGPRPLDLETAVTLPDSVFIPALEGKGHRHHSEPVTEPARNQSGNRKRRHPDKREQDAVASVIIFHSLSTLLPQRYDTDKRSLRVPKRPVINTPVVSITVHDNEELVQHALDKPITVQFRLVTTEERSKPICVFWNHSISAGGSGGWSSKGCEVVFRNSTHISCQCYHMTSFAVLMDISHRENGEILPIKLVTWSTVGVTLFFLFLTVVFLTCLRAMHSNSTSIITNGALTLFIAELLFILGINQTDNPGPLIFFFRIVFNKEARSAMRYCCGKKRPEHAIKSKPSYTCSSSYVDGRLYHLPYAESSVSLNGTLQSAKSQHSYVPFVLRDDGGLNNSQIALDDHSFHETKPHPDDHDSDSDSDLSELEDDQSGSYASTHSSDSEDEEGQYLQEECWENLATSTAKRAQDSSGGAPCWPGECEAGGGGARLRVETVTHPEEKAEDYGKENTLPLLPSLHNPHTHPHKGILKKKPLSPIAERNGINRIHNQLSVNISDPASSRGSSSSEGQGGGAKQDQLNGVAMSIKAGTVDDDSSGSDGSRQTAM